MEMQKNKFVESQLTKENSFYRLVYNINFYEPSGLLVSQVKFYSLIVIQFV